MLQIEQIIFKRKNPPNPPKKAREYHATKSALTLNEEKFVHAICAMTENESYFNATEAAKIAFPNTKYPGIYARELLAREKIKTAINLYRTKIMNEFDIAPKKILNEMASLAFSNQADFYNEDGTLKNVKDLPRGVAAALVGVKVNFSLNDMGKPVITQEIKLHDKRAALETLGKYHQMWSERFPDHMNEDKQHNDDKARVTRERLLKTLCGQIEDED